MDDALKGARDEPGLACDEVEGACTEFREWCDESRVSCHGFGLGRDKLRDAGGTLKEPSGWPEGTCNGIEESRYELSLAQNEPRERRDE